MKIQFYLLWRIKKYKYFIYIQVAIVSLGSTRPFEPICSQGQSIINEAILKTPSINRVIAITSLGVNESANGIHPLILLDLNWFTSLFVNYVIAKPIADKVIQENSIRDVFGKNGKPDFVLLRPGGLTNGPKTEKVLAKGNLWFILETGIGGGRISRADVAYFLLKETLQGPSYANKAYVLVSAWSIFKYPCSLLNRFNLRLFRFSSNYK